MKKSILLFGGSSGERLVSVASAQNLAQQYTFDEIYFLYPSGALSKVRKEELLAHKDAFQSEFRASQAPFARELEQATSHFKDAVLFLALHGTQGEDGALQSLFEKAGVAYTGSNSKASHLAFEKDQAKKHLAKAGAPVAAEALLPAEKLTQAESILNGFFRQHGKMVAKPLASGSSIGLYIIEDENSLDAASQSLAKEKHGGYLLEKFIQGRELTVGVLQGSQGLRPLPPSEVVLQAGHSFDYQGKYLGRGTTEITPALLTPEESSQAQKLALLAHQTLGCFGYSRTDMILTATGPVFLETNTLPGLSKASFIPQQLKAAGIEMRVFIESQLELASKR